MADECQHENNVMFDIQTRVSCLIPQIMQNMNLTFASDPNAPELVWEARVRSFRTKEPCLPNGEHTVVTYSYPIRI
jgi:hypothetical protein